MNLPIVLTSYNRPHLLQQCVNGLLKNNLDRKIYVFQDGPKNKIEEKIISKSIDICKNLTSNIFVSNNHLGLALNLKRARDFVFNNHELAIFIEDDVYLHSYYIEQLEDLYLQTNHYPFGIFSCYGDLEKTPVFNNNFVNSQLVNATMMWAYIMTKQSYLSIKSMLDFYYDILPKDYANRDERIKIAKDIQKKFNICKYSFDLNPYTGTQDNFLSNAIVTKGFYRISTRTKHLKHLGKFGTNYKNKSEDQYQRCHKRITNFFINDNIYNNIKDVCERVCYANF